MLAVHRLDDTRLAPGSQRLVALPDQRLHRGPRSHTSRLLSHHSPRRPAGEVMRGARSWASSTSPTCTTSSAWRAATSTVARGSPTRELKLNGTLRPAVSDPVPAHGRDRSTVATPLDLAAASAQEEEPAAPPARSLRDERDHRAADRGGDRNRGRALVPRRRGVGPNAPSRCRPRRGIAPRVPSQ
jgi:hypothetical protein